MKKQEEEKKPGRFNPFVLRRKWNNKRIAMVAMLIATSVAFVLIFTRILPITSIPTLKISIGGLPIKITGYIFGPIIGAITGALSDLISFAFLPTIYHPIYTLAFSLAGFIPGVFGYLMHRRWKFKGAGNPDDATKHNNINFILTIVFILISILVIYLFVYSSLANFNDALISDRNIFFVIAMSGSLSMLIVVLVGRFFLRPQIFNALLPIISFSVFLDIVNTPIVSWGDIVASNLDGEANYLTILTAHIIWTPIKSWGNLFVIFFAYSIVAPLIFNKTSNSWETELTIIDPIKNTKKTFKETQRIIEDNIIKDNYIKRLLRKRRAKKEKGKSQGKE